MSTNVLDIGSLGSLPANNADGGENWNVRYEFPSDLFLYGSLTSVDPLIVYVGHCCGIV